MVERVISAMLPHLYVYNTDHNLKENMLNPERLEEGWLVMKMVEFQPVFVWHRKRFEVDVKRIAVDAMEHRQEMVASHMQR